MSNLGQHHWNWLSQVEADLAHVDSHREDEKERLLSLCDAVLMAHPQNETARVMREKVMDVFCGHQNRISTRSEIKDASEISDITSCIEQVRQVIPRNGKIVGEIPREQAKRLLIGICQIHGVFDMIYQFDKEPNQAYDFLRHQMSIIHMVDDIRTIVGRENFHFFPECLLGDSDGRTLEAFRFAQHFHTQYREKEAYVRQISTQLEGAKEYFKCLRQRAAHNKRQATQEVSQLSAENRIICDMLSNSENIEHVHGISDSTVDKDLIENFRRNELGQLNTMYDEKTSTKIQLEWVDRLKQDRFRRMHPFVAERLHNKLSQGKAGVMTLGARHFSSGSYAQPNLVDISIEKYLLEKPELNDMHVFIVEPDYSLPIKNEE